MAEAPIQQTKVCTKCGVEKSLPEFHKAKDCRLGVRAHCKLCLCADARRRNAENRDLLLAKAKARRAADPEASRKYFRDWHHANREKRAAYKQAWIARNPEAYRASYKASHSRAQANAKKRLEAAVRVAVHKCVKTGKKTGRTFEVLGYSPDTLIEHLERQFTKGMDWSNYGQWHIDHIIPLSSFDYQGTDCPGFRAAWALTNLRPMWGRENILKGAKVLTLL